MSYNFKWNDIQFWTTDLPGNQDESKVGSANKNSTCSYTEFNQFTCKPR